MASIDLKVQGMSCGSCVKHVSAALTPISGVERVEVDLAAGRVRVTGEPQSASLLAALDAAGYPAQLVLAAPAVASVAGGPRGTCCCH
jgi:copper chaperone